MTCKEEEDLRKDTYVHENIGGTYCLKTIDTKYAKTVDYGYSGATTATRNQHGDIKKLVNNWSCGYISGKETQSGTSTRTFSYDAAHRLTQETNSALGLTKTYSYKPDGRIDKIVDSAKGDLQFHYDNRGRLHSINTTTAAYTYDLFGNRTKRVTLDRTDDYTYNASNQLIKVDVGYTTDAEYKYNADGVRCKKIVDGVTTEYYLDGDKILGEKHVSEDYSLYFIYDAFGINSIEYNETSYKLIKDHQDNVIAMLNAAGDLIARYEYDAFGNCKVFNKYGTEITNSLGVAGINPFRWKSFYFDTETGLYYANGSYYDPEVGQYVDAAPIETVGDNAFCAGKLDRSAPVCDNILERIEKRHSNSHANHINSNNLALLSLLASDATTLYGIGSALYDNVPLIVFYIKRSHTIRNEFKLYDISIIETSSALSNVTPRMHGSEWLLLGIDVLWDIYDSQSRGISIQGIIGGAVLTTVTGIGLAYLSKGIIWSATTIGSAICPGVGTAVGLLIGLLASIAVDIFVGSKLEKWIDSLFK